MHEIEETVRDSPLGDSERPLATLLDHRDSERKLAQTGDSEIHKATPWRWGRE